MCLRLVERKEEDVQTPRQPRHSQSAIKYSKRTPDPQVNSDFSRAPELLMQGPAKLQIEEIELADLNAAKLEQCVHDFIVDIFR
jgi:hypothetical protein